MNRAVEDLNLGPLVETHMTRCISCTRCVRFTTEVAGISQMGQIGRGEDSEITSYLSQSLNSELQGNIIDLCPVGALTSKPYAFSARSWELEKTDSIDVMDALGSNIRLDSKGREIMRILPRNNDGINEEWISDKTRFVFDGLRRQRLDRPYVRKDGRLVAVEWDEAFEMAETGIKNKNLASVVGDLASTETTYALKLLSESLGGSHECRVDKSCLSSLDRSGYVGVSEISELDNCDKVVLIGTNPKIECPVFNARIRKAWLNGAEIYVIGQKARLTYDYNYLGEDRLALKDLVENDNINFNSKPFVVLGQGALIDWDGDSVLQATKKLVEKFSCKFLILHVAASRVGALEIGFTHKGGITSSLDNAEAIFNLGMDEFDLPEDRFVIYQGSHGDRGAHRADVIFPSACYTEESGIFVNTEGRPQLSLRANFSPGESKENWSIIRAFAGKLKLDLGFDDLLELRAKLIKEFPRIGRLDQTEKPEWVQSVFEGFSQNVKFKPYYKDFYKTNPIARASLIMNDLSKRSDIDDQIIAAE